MITLYDHIQELRAELRGSYFTRRERAALQAELAKAIAEQAELRPRVRHCPGGAVESHEGDRGRRVSGPSLFHAPRDRLVAAPLKLVHLSIYSELNRLGEFTQRRDRARRPAL